VKRQQRRMDAAPQRYPEEAAMGRNRLVESHALAAKAKMPPGPSIPPRPVPEASVEPPASPARARPAPPGDGRGGGDSRTASKKKRHGNDFRQTDIPLLEEMNAMVGRSAMSATQAAWRLINADKVPGPGKPESKVTRLVKQYHERWPGQRRRRGREG